ARTWTNVLAATQNGTRDGEGFLRRPDNPSIVWSALEGGLAYSTDGGDNWMVIFEDIATKVGYDGNAIRTGIAWTQSNPNRMYWLVGGRENKGGYDQVGVFRSDD